MRLEGAGRRDQQRHAVVGLVDGAPDPVDDRLPVGRRLVVARLEGQLDGLAAEPVGGRCRITQSAQSAMFSGQVAPHVAPVALAGLERGADRVAVLLDQVAQLVGEVDGVVGDLDALGASGWPSADARSPTSGARGSGRRWRSRAPPSPRRGDRRCRCCAAPFRARPSHVGSVTSGMLTNSCAPLTQPIRVRSPSTSRSGARAI